MAYQRKINSHIRWKVLEAGQGLSHCRGIALVKDSPWEMNLTVTWGGRDTQGHGSGRQAMGVTQKGFPAVSNAAPNTMNRALELFFFFFVETRILDSIVSRLASPTASCKHPEMPKTAKGGKKIWGQKQILSEKRNNGSVAEVNRVKLGLRLIFSFFEFWLELASRPTLKCYLV